MSGHNLLYQMADAEVPDKPVIGRKGRGTLYATGSAVPDDGTAGYAPGCLFVKDGTPNELYFNNGTKDSCAFKKVTVAS